MRAPTVDLASWEKRLPRSRLVERDSYILERCRGKSVVHLGAADAPFARERALAGTLLHQRLREVCGALVGIDADVSSVELLREEFGIHDIRTGDLASTAQAPILSEPADVVVCGDVIEHVNDAGALLTVCNRYCRQGGEVIVSTINALGAKPMLRAMRGREAVHPDHVAYYSPATLGVIVTRFGFEPVDWRFFRYGTVHALGRMAFALLFAAAPFVADGLLVRAVKRREAGARS